jgi:hypothetical protein
MSTVKPETAAEPEVDAAPETDDEQTANPWEGIPDELLDAERPYDEDTAGGCG